MRTARGAVRQALANNLQPLTVFFKVNAGQVGSDRTRIAVNLFIGIFGTANHHLLVMHAHAVKLPEVMLPALDEHIAAARVHAILDYSHLATRLFPGRVFGAVDEAAQIALFHPAETVDLFLHVDTVTKGLNRSLSDRKVHVVTQGEDMDQNVILGGGRKTFAIRNKVFQLFCAFAAAQMTPDGAAKGDHRAQMGFGEFGLEGGQFINENFAGRAQGIHVPFDVGFNPNRRPAMFWQNATLNLRHRSS